MCPKAYFTTHWQCDYARCGDISLPSKRRIETPVLWFSVWIEDELRHRYLPLMKKEFRETLLVNAYHVLTNRFVKTGLRSSIHEALHYKGPIALDSGGFLFQSKSKMSIDPLIILDVQRKLKPDIAIPLDYPLKIDEPENYRTRIEKTLHNLSYYTDLNESFLVLPVIHGYNFRQVDKMIEGIKRVLDVNFVAIGSLVPLAFFRIKNAAQLVVSLISYVRKKLPDSFLHVFGVGGGATTMHLLYSLGADSVDSNAWEKKAAYGCIQLPGTTDRYFRKAKALIRKKSFLSIEEKKTLRNCECPVCRAFSIEDLERKRDLRVVHNAWVFQHEVYLARQHIKEGTYQRFAEKRLSRSPRLLKLYRLGKSKLIS